MVEQKKCLNEKHIEEQLISTLKFKRNHLKISAIFKKTKTIIRRMC